MNPNKYCTVSASQRLVAAGIKIIVEKWWCHVTGGSWYLLENPNSREFDQVVPAPSMSELWRELPDEAYCQMRPSRKTVVGVRIQVPAGMIEDDQYINENPCDALADLLIFVRGRK